MRLQLIMSKCEMSHKKAQKAQKSEKIRAIVCAFCAFLWLISVGCRRDMQDQPKIKPLRGSTFFRDGLASRRPIEGTIPRGYLRDDNPEFYTGKKAGALTASAAPAQQQTANPNTPTAAAQQDSFPDDVVEFPIPVTKEVVERGRS